MRYHDPERPIGLSKRPCYVSPQGRLIAALPALRIEPEEELGMWYVSCELLVDNVTGRTFGSSFTQEGLRGFMLYWLENPEAAMKLLGYDASWRDKHRVTYVATEKTVLSLSDLGL